MDVEYREKERIRNATRIREKRRNNPEFRAKDGAATAEYLRKKRENNPEFQRSDNARRTALYRSQRDGSAVELLLLLRRGELIPIGNPCFVYMFYNSNGMLLYVGITNDPKRRLYQHARDKAWFENIGPVALTACRTETEAVATEAFLIKSMRPLHNIRHNNGEFAYGDTMLLSELLLRFASIDLLPVEKVT